MAKEKQGQAKIRIFYADVEGGDSSSERMLQSIAGALARAMHQPQRPIVRQLPPGETKVGNGHEEVTDGIEESPEVEEEQSAPDRSEKKASKQKPPTYSFVKDLNLRPSDKESLKEFFEKKKPTDQQEQFLVILFYLKEILGLPSVGADHIYSGFNEVNKKSPLNILKIARQIANRKGWIDSSLGDNLRMVVKGQNFVKHELPHSESTSS